MTGPIETSFGAHPFYLDSGPGFGNLGTRSFSGRNPSLVIRAWGNVTEVESRGHVETHSGDPLDILRAVLTRHAIPDGDSRGLSGGGLVGYLGYGLRRWMEMVPMNASDDLRLPDLWFGCYDEIETTPASTPQPADGTADVSSVARTQFGASTIAHDDYLEKVDTIKRYIHQGDVYQVNLTQRFSDDFTGDPLRLYRNLKAVNPSPFAAYLDCEAFQIISASPERFLRYDPMTRRVETMPIKGTRPRGTPAARDDEMRSELLASAKDRAEHMMIVDLERNDLGRVCETGSVHVPELCVPDKHPSVWHLVSTATGSLREDCDRIDLLRATFPGGSITGAPKIRAMEIIDEIEPVERGVYTGAIGYLGFDGSMDMNIAIRTMVAKDGRAHVFVGGGIVADSDPGAEYAETMDKAKALFHALNQPGSQS